MTTHEGLEGFRLSPQQKRVWQLQQQERHPVYGVRASIAVEGDLETNVLKQALEDVIQRYEIFRTLFQCPHGMALPMQVIADALPPVVQEYDLRDVAPDDQPVNIKTLADVMPASPYDIARGPMFWGSVIRLSASRHMLLVYLPALWADMTTATTMVADIGAAYAARLRGDVFASDEACMQYADLAEWQWEMFESAEAETGGTFWRERDFFPYLQVQFPGERLSAPGPFNPQAIQTRVEPAIAANLQAFAAARDVTVSLVLLACWQVLLHRLTGQADIVVGTACDGRTYEGLEDAVGPLAKYLPLGSHLDGDVRFSTVLERTSDALTEAFAWQEYFTWDFFESREPGFFPWSFDFIEQPERYETGEIAFSLQSLDSCTDRFEVKLAVFQRGEAIGVDVYYDANVLRTADVERFAGQFHTLLASATHDAELTVDQLDILPDDQRHQILVAFNDTHAPYPQTCIHHLIEAQAERTPSEVAVVCEAASLTYAELNARANQLAHHLQELGVGPDTLVGIHVERSLEMLVGLLGILKAGGAYVPLDPEYPPERLVLMLEDTQTPVLVTQAHLLANTPGYTGQVVCLDTDWVAIGQADRTNPSIPVGPEHLAYVMFTSGSTGQPKGVPIRHRNLVHSTSARMHYYQEPVQRFLLLSSYAFDSSVAGLFWTLCTGGTLVLPLEGLQRDPQQVAHLISQSQITHMLSLPSLYAYILAEATAQNLTSLRTVIVAGEACPQALVARHNALLPDTALFNEYGPTEGTVWCSVYDCRSLPPGGSTVPIGRPIANTQIYILDDAMRPVPVGVPGELHLGGGGLAQGYLNRPALTAEKFVAHPFSQETPGTVLYKTGDLACFRPDGHIEFLGRIDHQVKIRGYRIELGEIEAILQQHPTVQEAVVVTREKPPAPSRSRVEAVDTPDTADLVEQMRLLDEAKAERLLAEIERLTEDETGEILN